MRVRAYRLAQERARLESMGRPHSPVDGMIAAVAATRSLILVTRNTADFADFRNLHVENPSRCISPPDIP